VQLTISVPNAIREGATTRPESLERSARLALVRASRQVIGNVLAIPGVGAPREV